MRCETCKIKQVDYAAERQGDENKRRRQISKGLFFQAPCRNRIDTVRPLSQDGMGIWLLMMYQTSVTESAASSMRGLYQSWQAKMAGGKCISLIFVLAALSIPSATPGSDIFSYYLMNRISAVVFESML